MLNRFFVCTRCGSGLATIDELPTSCYAVIGHKKVKTGFLRSKIESVRCGGTEFYEFVVKQREVKA